MRLDIRGSYLDAMCFLKRNKAKFLLLLFLCIIVAIFGIIHATIIREITRECIHRYNVFRVLSRNRGFFGYYFSRIAVITITLLGITLFGFRKLFAPVSIVILLFYTHQTFFMIGGIFVYSTVVVFPVMLVGVVPLALINLFFIISYATFVFSTSSNYQVCKFSDLGIYYRTVLPVFGVLKILIAIAVLLEAALIFLLRLGITL